MVQGGSDTIAEQGAARGCNAEAQPPHELIGAFQTDFQQQISELMVWPALADLAVARLAPIAAEMRRIAADPSYIDGILADGGERASQQAEATMKKVREIVGLIG